jgi:hypothetical protein
MIDIGRYSLKIIFAQRGKEFCLHLTRVHKVAIASTSNYVAVVFRCEVSTVCHILQ